MAAVLGSGSALASGPTAVAQSTTRAASGADALQGPVIEGRWLRPAASATAQPIWGHAEGLRVGLYPRPDPRGLLHIYTPYIGQSADCAINFIAIEPIVKGSSQRGLSELETSKLDRAPGKRIWSADDAADAAPRLPQTPARGRISDDGGVEALRVFLPVERFDNGADVFLRLTFRADRPHEVAVAVFARDDSAELDRCILTATMGNFARLRELRLADRTVTAAALWPDYRDDAFTPHAEFPLQQLLRRRDGSVEVAAAPDERHPDQADYAPGTRRHWHYVGQPALQIWRCEKPDPQLLAAVNGRAMYWRSKRLIPGGVAFENFEMQAPFRQGQEYVFVVEPMTPAR